MFLVILYILYLLFYAQVLYSRRSKQMEFRGREENTIMKAILEIMQNFIERGMNVRVDVVGGVPMFSAVPLEQKAYAAAPRSAKKRMVTAYCG